MIIKQSFDLNVVILKNEITELFVNPFDLKINVFF